jgi:hypothetical protein
MIKKIFIGLLVVLVIIQFIQPAKNKSTTSQPNDIGVTMNVPDDVSIVLRKACYDCHSNNTNYPWYASIQPVSWWLNHHIDEGKDELNFSEFGAYKMKRKIKKFNEIAGEVTDGEMPLESYTWIHKDAKLTKEEASALINWANLMATKLEQDSLRLVIQ